MIRPKRLWWLLLPVLLGADCPGAESRERWVRVELMPSRGAGDDAPPAQTQSVRVRFRRETASRDLALEEGLTLEGSVLADGAPVPRPNARLHFRHRDSGTETTAEAHSGGQFVATGLLPGTYDVTIYPDADQDLLGIARLVVQLPDDDLADLPIPWGEHVLWGRIVRREIGVPDPVGIADLVVEAFRETEPGTLRRAGQETITLDDGEATIAGEFTLALPAGTYALRISSPTGAEVPYPTAVLTGVEMPRPGGWVPVDTPITLFTYPTWSEERRHELSGKLVAPGIGVDLPEGSALVEARGVVHAPPEYAGLEDIDFQLGPVRARVRTDTEGDFRLTLPDATYTLDVIPGYDSDGSAFRDAGEQAHVVANDLPLGTVFLTSRVNLTMRVVDDADRVIEGARVEVRNLGLSGYATGLSTDETGTARFLLEQGPHRVEVIPPEGSGLARDRFEVEMGTVDERLIVPLEDGIRVSGQVSRGNDLLEGVLVRFVDPDSGEVLGEGVSRASGTYELRVPTAWVWPETEAGDDDSAG